MIISTTDYQQIDGVEVGSPLGPTLANAFLSHHESKCLDYCPIDFKPTYYRRYVDDIFVLFKSSDHLPLFKSYMNSRHHSMSFSSESEKDDIIPFLDIQICREGGKFSGVYTHFDSFVPMPYKFGMIYYIVYRCFTLCSSFQRFHKELEVVKEIFRKNGYPISFIGRCIKFFLDKIHTPKITVTTVEKQRLPLILSYSG